MILGPENWFHDFPVAKEGIRQSPIDITTDVAVPDDGLLERPLKWHYSPESVIHIENTGQSWTVKVAGQESSKILLIKIFCFILKK